MERTLPKKNTSFSICKLFKWLVSYLWFFYLFYANFKCRSFNIFWAVAQKFKDTIQKGAQENTTFALSFSWSNSVCLSFLVCSLFLPLYLLLTLSPPPSLSLSLYTLSLHLPPFLSLSLSRSPTLSLYLCCHFSLYFSLPHTLDHFHIISLDASPLPLRCFFSNFFNASRAAR